MVSAAKLIGKPSAIVPSKGKGGKGSGGSTFPSKGKGGKGFGGRSWSSKGNDSAASRSPTPSPSIGGKGSASSVDLWTNWVQGKKASAPSADRWAGHRGGSGDGAGSGGGGEACGGGGDGFWGGVEMAGSYKGFFAGKGWEYSAGCSGKH